MRGKEAWGEAGADFFPEPAEKGEDEKGLADGEEDGNQDIAGVMGADIDAGIADECGGEKNEPAGAAKEGSGESGEGKIIHGMRGGEGASGNGFFGGSRHFNAERFAESKNARGGFAQIDDADVVAHVVGPGPTHCLLEETGAEAIGKGEDESGAKNEAASAEPTENKGEPGGKNQKRQPDTGAGGGGHDPIQRGMGPGAVE